MKILKRIGMGLLVILLVIGIGKIVYDAVNLPKRIPIGQTMSGFVLAENGESYTCDVRIDGEMVLYPFEDGQSQFNGNADGGIWINGKFETTYMVFLPSNDSAYAHWPSDSGGAMMSRNCDLFVASKDLQSIFPDEESMRCIVVAPANDEAEAKALLKQLTAEELPDLYQDIFSWILKGDAK